MREGNISNLEHRETNNPPILPPPVMGQRGFDEHSGNAVGRGCNIMLSN